MQGLVSVRARIFRCFEILHGWRGGGGSSRFARL